PTMRWHVVPLLLLTPFRSFAQDVPDVAKLLTVRKGTLPIIVSAPHGGAMPIPGVPERRGEGVAKFVTVRDTNTDILAEKLVEELEKKLGGKVYLVVARFERKCLDVNRPAAGAYESD